MKKFKISILRTSVRIMDVEVEADSENEACDKAHDMAGDLDFNQVTESGVEYETEVIHE